MRTVTPEIESIGYPSGINSIGNFGGETAKSLPDARSNYEAATLSLIRQVDRQSRAVMRGPDRWLPVQNPAYYLLDAAPRLWRGAVFCLDFGVILGVELRGRNKLIMTPASILRNIQ